MLKNQQRKVKQHQEAKANDGGHLEKQNMHEIEGEASSRGNPRANRSTGVSYCRLTRDYKKCFKWTLEYNRRLYLLYLEAEASKKGYQQQLKDLWDVNEPENTKFTPRHLGQQVRNIIKKKLLSDTELQELQREYKLKKGNYMTPGDNNDSTERGEEIHQGIPPGDNEHPITTGEYEHEITSKNEEQNILEDNNRGDDNDTDEDLELKEEIRERWKYNFQKYIKMNINMREYNVNLKPTPEEKYIKIVDEIVNEELNNIEEEYEIDM